MDLAWNLGYLGIRDLLESKLGRIRVSVGSMSWMRNAGKRLDRGWTAKARNYHLDTLRIRRGAIGCVPVFRRVL